MKKIISVTLAAIIICACAVYIVSCVRQPKPYEIIYEGHRISLWMTREEIEGMLGEGTERKSQISPWGADVVAYGENLEISYAGQDWNDDPAKQVADQFFFNDPETQSYQGIKAGDDIDTVPTKYEFSLKVGGGYEINFLQSHNVADSIYAIHDLRIAYYNDDYGNIGFVEITNWIHTPLSERFR